MIQMFSVFVTESGSPGGKWIYINISTIYYHMILLHFFKCFKYQQVFFYFFKQIKMTALCAVRDPDTTAHQWICSPAAGWSVHGEERLCRPCWLRGPSGWVLHQIISRVRTVYHLPEASNHFGILELPLVSSCCLVKRMNCLFIL